MTETFRIKAKSLLKTHYDCWAMCHIEDTYTTEVEAESEVLAAELGKEKILVELAEKGEWDELTVCEVVNVKLEAEERENRKKAEEEIKANAKAKKLAREIEKAEAEGMTLEEYRKNKATKALCTRLEREIAELEEELARKKKVLTEKKRLVK